MTNDDMNNPKFQTRVVHSNSNPAWNIVNDSLGMKFKIAVIPYLVLDDKTETDREKNEALSYATFISDCFNNIPQKRFSI